MPAVTLTFNEGALAGIAGKLPKASGVEVVLYQKMAIGTGAQAGNPWLQEMPDPITKVTWDNYITMNPAEMEKGGYATTYDQEHGLNMAAVTVNGVKLTLPVYPSPGQVAGTIGITLGYGRGEGNEEVGNAAYQTLQYGGFATDEKGNRIPVGQNAYRASIEHGTALTDSYLNTRSEYDKKNLDMGVRQQLTASALADTPNYQHPVVKKELNRIASQFAAANPDASPQEVAQAAKKYIDDLQSALNPTAKKDVNGPDSGGEMDWSKYLEG